METHTIIFNEKNFVFKKMYKEKIYYECKNLFKLKCKSIFLFDFALKSHKIITRHNKNCSNLPDVFKKETTEGNHTKKSKNFFSDDKSNLQSNISFSDEISKYI